MARPKKQTPTPTQKTAPSNRVIGGSNFSIQRTKTPWVGFNLACGGGIPLHCAIEIAGQTQSAKSTMGYAICGAVDPAGDVGLIDVENMDTVYPVSAADYASNWKGRLWIPPEIDSRGTPLSHGNKLDEGASYFSLHPEMKVLMVDSVGNLSPTAAQQGEAEDSIMGRRALMVRNFLEKMEAHLRRKPSLLVLINHLHPKIGGQGMITSGGQAMQYKPALKIRVWADQQDSYWIIKGSMPTKRKYIPPDWPYSDEFQLVCIPGKGIHRGMTAVNDCLQLKQATKEANGGVKFNGKSYGQFGRMAGKPPNDEVFWPFIDALKKEYPNGS